MTPADLTARQITEEIRAGHLTALEVTEACLARIADTDPKIKAWAFLDPDLARAQARALDAHGASVGPLHGVPVGLKDIIDTADMPTECGTPIYAGRQPTDDAGLVTQLKAAGAVIMGKTKTTELAYMQPTDTTNPRNPAYSPGGSSSGSAAAVAARHVPLAVGTQTGGSVIRPASFCGIYGMKPSYEAISRRGVFQTCETLDHVGGFANSVDDLALLMSVIGGLKAPTAANPPRLAWLDMPYDADLPAETRARFETLVVRLNAERSTPSDAITALADAHKTIYDVEIAHNVSPLAQPEDFSASMQAAIARAKTISDANYHAALAARDAAMPNLRSIFRLFDAVLTPAAPGEAPALSENTTGSAICNVTWSLTGNPTVTLPLLTGDTGLPIGLQIVGPLGEDRRLLHIAQQIEEGVRT